jgi:hypothetical protein
MLSGSCGSRPNERRASQSSTRLTSPLPSALVADPNPRPGARPGWSPKRATGREERRCYLRST